MRSWYEIKAKKDSADIYIYDEIGFFGITASRFVSELRQLKGKALNVFINSPGGDVFDSVAIYNALARHDGPVSVVVDGIAASGASVIAQAGSKRTMGTGSSMMIHDAWGIAMGPASEMEKMASELDKISDSVADIYAERAGGTAEEWRERMRDETWYNADDAVGANLADEVRPEAQGAYAGRVFNLSKFKKAPEWVPQDNTLSDEAQEAIKEGLAAIFAALSTQAGAKPESGKEPEMADLNEVRAALGLDDDGDIIAAISTLKQSAKDLSTGEKGVENQLRRELAEARQTYLSTKAELEQRITALEERNREKEAEYKVDTAISQGRVAPKDRDVALKLALNDPEAFATFAAGLRVDLSERGTATDSEMAGLELTPDEAKMAKQLGISREDLIAEKAAERGIALPKK